MPNPARRTIALAVLAAAIVAGAIALDLAPVAAQSDDETGRIVARRLDDGRTEFGWQPAGAARVLPRARYFPADARPNRWLRSSPVEVGGAEIGRINARLRSDGRIEFGFTPTDGERIEPNARYFPVDARVGRWLRSTEIEISAAPATGFVAVSVNFWHSCAIRAESGAIECWGNNEYGQTDAPAGRFTAVSAGHRHTCAIRESGEIACWGRDDDLTFHEDEDAASLGYVGATIPPAGSFTAVAAGVTHSCAIRAESGAIECWGDDRSGFLDAPAGSFTAVSTNYRTCAIRAESGAIECWGASGSWWALPPLAGSFTAVSVGTEYACGLRWSGEIACWGNNGGGATDAPAGSFVAVAAGTGDTCGLRESGAIECWGWNTYGLTDDAPAGRFTAISASKHAHHACAIRDTGAIECWGANEAGQADPPAP